MQDAGGVTIGCHGHGERSPVFYPPYTPDVNFV